MGVNNLSRKIINNDWIEKEKSKYKQNITILDNYKNYGYDSIFSSLYELLDGRIPYLKTINSFALSEELKEEYSYKNEGVFFISYEDFSRLNNIGRSTANRYINLFCILGFIEKVPTHKMDNKALEQIFNGYRKGKKNSNLYIVYNIDDVIKVADQRAKVLLESGFKVRDSVNKEYLIFTLGQELANKVYLDDRNVSKRTIQIVNGLERTLKRLLNEQGYTTKKEVVSKTRLSGRLKANKSKKEAELEKYFTQMLRDNHLEYVKANKTIMDKYNLTKAIYVIIPKN